MLFWGLARISTIQFVLVGLAQGILVLNAMCANSAHANDEFGPPNWLKNMPTPFGAAKQEVEDDNETRKWQSITLDTKEIKEDTVKRSLSSRLVLPRLYLPGRMILGKPAEFIVKGRPGSFVALAMADRNSGAKPIYGQELHLGADRKVVAIGQIPESGLMSLAIETPIQGDLIGQYWYFEAVLWKQPDYSDIELAVPVASEEGPLAESKDKTNGVMVISEIENKRGPKITPEAAIPLYQKDHYGTSSLDAGRP